jgi:hypothetical protein
VKPGTQSVRKLLVRQIVQEPNGESFLNHFGRHMPPRADACGLSVKGVRIMKGILIAVAATVLGTMAYVMIGMALASVS